MQPPCLWIRGEYIPLRGVPATPEATELKMGYEPKDPPRTIKNGTHWVDNNLNAWKGTNLLAMSVPPAPDLPPPEPPLEFPKILDPPWRYPD
jgi:hypothetical protein